MNINNFNKINDWISGSITEEAVKFAEELGLHLCHKQTAEDRFVGKQAMTTSQIRNVFGEIKRIQAKGYDSKEGKASFLLLRPKIAYAEARVLSKGGESRIRDFRRVMEKAHSAVNSVDTFQNFVDFMEAILAYHKFFGGKES